ncbi:MAG TPA: XopAK family type III secretion system effector [Noviherbaspirillum sp.]|jgi:hypothetical protein|uniref:XopAK family type III secretion system effector n=1 Tax=Noviherbaspirillum sp. TaxID=1926288 RepID=UPI002F952D78
MPTIPTGSHANMAIAQPANDFDPARGDPPAARPEAVRHADLHGYRAVNAFGTERWLARGGASPGRAISIIPASPHQRRHRAIVETDMAPYRALEQRYGRLFRSPAIVSLAEDAPVAFGPVRHVGMEEMELVNATREQVVLGTSGLGPCIAICARGTTRDGEIILGLNHYSGIETEVEAMSGMDEQMRDEGATNTSFYLVGGMIMPQESTAGTWAIEERFLALSDQFNIQGVRLHTSVGEQNMETGEDNAVDVVLTPQAVFFRQSAMYVYPDT